MRIAVIGAGRVGAALGRRFGEAGHEIVHGVRDPSDPKHAEMAVAPLADAARQADVIVLAVPWTAAEEACRALGEIGGRVVIDATNPLAGDNRTHDFRHELSGAERIAEWLDGGRVVKAFNTTGSGNMVNPSYPGGAPAMFIAGDDRDAKSVVLQLAGTIGFDAIDAGALTASRDLEHLATMWIRLAYGLGHGPDIAFALLRR